jgi:hypothetical protein
MLRRLVFTHIPKAAGSSVWRLLHQIAETQNLNLLAVGGASSTLANADLSDRTFAARGLRLKDYQIITGHVPFATAARYFMPAVFVTVLRDPRWQLISNYCSQPENKAKHDFGMSEFIAQVKASPNAEWALDNNQTRMLANEFRLGLPATSVMLEEAKANLFGRYEAVGNVQSIEVFHRSLAQLCGTPPGETPHTNATGAYGDYVGEEHLAFAAEVNAIDMQLYSWAQEHCISVGPSRIDAVSPPYPIRRSSLAAPLARLAVNGYRKLKSAPRPD